MANGPARLNAWIKQLRALPEEMTREALPAVAEALRDDVARSVAAGQAPDGSAWQAKQDGGQPLVGADQDVTVEVLGTVVLMKLSGKFVRHHRGMARGGVKRVVIPTRKVPDAVGRVIHKVFGQAFQRAAGAK